MSAWFTKLDNRTLLRINGKDAESFLQGLVTCNVENMAAGQLTFGALLSAQGKIQFDFFILNATSSFIIDIDKSMVPDFVTRLNFYKLRADVTIEPMDKRTSGYALWGNKNEIGKIVADGVINLDPRLDQMGARAYIRRPPENAQFKSLDEWHQHRVKLGMPEGGLDFSFGDAFPHEALMDQFNGVDFSKGCYVGQEVVSRIHHRKSARKRLIQVRSEKKLPTTRPEILINNKNCGVLASTAQNNGLAMIRLDRASMHAKGEKAFAGTQEVTLKIQSWCNFSWPE